MESMAFPPGGIGLVETARGKTTGPGDIAEKAWGVDAKKQLALSVGLIAQAARITEMSCLRSCNGPASKCMRSVKPQTSLCTGAEDNRSWHNQCESRMQTGIKKWI